MNNTFSFDWNAEGNPYQDLFAAFNFQMDDQIIHGSTVEEAQARWEQIKIQRRSKDLSFTLPDQEGIYVITDA